jgi:hypothetical protein
MNIREAVEEARRRRLAGESQSTSFVSGDPVVGRTDDPDDKQIELPLDQPLTETNKP